MFKLKNVSKIYISKSKQKVVALKDINLEINDIGLVFFLGKSGSGKSTLLNILGGLDSATSGEVFVEGQSFTDFKQADYDNYRNQYVGFVFQEFNLLNDFDVAGNIALALRLSKETDISDKVSGALQAVGLSSEYLTRKIDELSGGEKQRVAIARAIVKDSKVILADEPTGNLDSGTGESIWNIIKELSKTKLVIAVTHDRESAEKYGDRIIEISDGKIVSDNGEQPATHGKKYTFSPTKKKLSNAVCFKMGANNLLQRKVKSVSVVLLAVFTIFTILLTQVLLSFSAEKSFAKFICNNNIDYIEITQGKLSYGNEFNPNRILKPSTLKYIDDNANYIKDGCIGTKQDILDMGLSFAGEALELDDNSFYLTTAGLENAYYWPNSCVEIDGEKVKLIKEKHPAEFLIGKKVDINYNIMGCTLAGVIDVDKCNPLIADAFPEYFYKESFNGREAPSAITLNTSPDLPDAVMNFGYVIFAQVFKGAHSVSRLITSDGGGGKILTERGLQNVGDITLAEDEIVFTYELYAKLFDVSPQWSYVSTDLTEVISMPRHIGQRFPLKFFEYGSDELLIDTGDLKIAGIVFSYKKNSQPENALTFATGKKTADKIAVALSVNSRIVVQVASIDNLQKFLVNLRNKHDGYILNAGADDSIDYSGFIYGFEQNVYLFKIIFLFVAVLFTVILLLLVINLISFSIVNRKKEIGILSALGATNGDITKIFVIETLLIASVTFIFNLAAILVGVVVFDNVFCSGLLLTVSLLRFDYITLITLIAASFGLMLLAALLPLKKIIKLKPVDAIKNL